MDSILFGACGPPVCSVEHEVFTLISNLDVKTTKTEAVICAATVSSPYTLGGGGVAPEAPTLLSDFQFLHKNNLMAVWREGLFIHVPLDN